MEFNKDENYNNVGGINAKASAYITGPNQFLDIRNYGFIKPGALVSRPGREASATFSSQTFLPNPMGMIQFTKSDGVSHIVFDQGPTLFIHSPFTAVGASLTPNVTTAYPLDMEVGGDVLYAANGYAFKRYDGSYSTFYNIPSQRTFIIGAGITYNLSLGSLGSTIILAQGFYQFKYAYKRGSPTFSGIYGERTSDENDVGINVPFLGVTITPTLVTTTGQWLVYGITVTDGFGISAILPYLDLPAVGTSYIAAPTAAAFFATTYSGITLYTIRFNHFTGPTDYENQFNYTLVPSYIETYKNMLFLAGFSGFPSAVWHTELGEFERLEPENFFDVRTGNADRIQCLVVFQDSLIVFKNRSIHEIKGDSPETLSQKDMSLEYGCVNNSAAVTFMNKLWFMDENGICEYNGPDTFIVSYAIEPYLNAADKTKCRAIHVKKRSEVWFCCADEAFVYDYDMNAWTIYDNIPIEFERAGEIIDFTDSRDVAYFDKVSDVLRLARFNDSLATDFGQAITLSYKTRFHKRQAEGAESTEEIWRRFYSEITPTSVTLTALVNFYPNYGESIAYSTTVATGDFQVRTEIGIPSRSIAVEFILQASEEITFNGYTLESRYLRPI